MSGWIELWHKFTSSWLKVTLKEEFTGRIKFSFLLPPAAFGEIIIINIYAYLTIYKNIQRKYSQYLITAMFTGAVHVTSLVANSIPTRWCEAYLNFFIDRLMTIG